MANDLDMWQDIEALGKRKATKQQSEDLLELYYNRYCEFNPEIVEKLKKAYIDKYKFLDNYI